MSGVRRYGITVALTVAAAVAIAVAIDGGRTREYEATATLAVNNKGEDARALGASAPPLEPRPEASAEPAAQLIETLERPDVLRTAQQELPRAMTIAQLRKIISAHPEGTSGTVAVTARSTDPQLAAIAANAVARARAGIVTAKARQRYSQAAEDVRAQVRALGRAAQSRALQTVYERRAAQLEALAAFAEPLAVRSVATTPRHPVTPRPVRDGLVAGVGGLLAGLGLALVLRRRERGLPQDALRDELNLVLIGAVPERLLGRVVAAERAGSADDLEAFRFVLKNLQRLGGGDRVAVVAVTGPVAEDGKSTVAASLAFAAARSGLHTMLVDCDLRRPVLAARLVIANGPGLAECITGKGTTAVCADRLSDSLHCIPAGRPSEDAIDRLDSDALPAVLAELRARYDLVVLDTPPLLGIGDTLAIVPHVDAVLLCIRAGRTTREEAREALARLEALAPRRPTGLVAAGTG